MKIKMLEHFQGAGANGVLLRTGSTVNALEPGEVYEVDNALGAYLLENRKAEEEAAKGKKAKPVHYGAQAEPELRDDETLHKKMNASKESEPDFLETLPDEATEPQPEKKSKRHKGAK